MGGIRLTDDDRRMLDGEQGPARRKAMEFIVRFAEVLGVGELCDVTWADLFCGAHGYLSAAGTDDFDRVFSTMCLCSPEVAKLDRMKSGCVCFSGVEADCTETEPEMLIDSDLKARNLEYLTRFSQAGVVLSGNCIPYLTGFMPLRGEHFVSCESSAVLFMNSLWGARGNGDGLQAAFASAVSGRTPKHGLHLAENRKATVPVEILTEPRSVADWDLLGYAVGRKLEPMAVPFLTGGFPRPGAIELKAFFSALACAAGTELCFIEGVTPEGLTLDQAFGGFIPDRAIRVETRDLISGIGELNPHEPQKIDYVTLGCPHYHIDEIRRIAEFMDGRKVASGTLVHLWTAGSIKFTARRNGYLDILEKAGIRVLTGSCPSSRGYPEEVRTAAYDSAKQRMSAAQEFSGKMFYGSLEECLGTAISGHWAGC